MPRTSTPAAMDPIHRHGNPQQTLLPLLKALLPYSLPLYRRIQYGQPTEHTHVFASVAPQTSDEADQGKEHVKDAPATCLAAAYIDRSVRPEAEALIFLSWDTPSHNTNTPSCQCHSLLFSLLRHVDSLPYPPLSDEARADALAAVNSTDAATASRHHTHASAPAAAYVTNLDDADLLKIGALHERSVAALKARGCVRLDLPGAEFPYVKYLIPRGQAGERDALDEGLKSRGLRWGELSDEDLALVRSRTAIPRTTRTLRSLPAAALFPASPDGAAPVAWAFLGKDGSLCSLHVEPEHRGCGLAKAVAKKLFREGWGLFGDELDGLGHADVAAGNLSSKAVCLSLGGVEGWGVYWIRVALSKVVGSTGKTE